MAMDSLTLWHVSTVLLGRSFTRTNQTGLFPLVPNKGSTWLGVPPSWERSSCLTNKVKMEFVFQLSSLMGHGKPPYIAHCHLDEPNLKANSISFYITCKYIYIYVYVHCIYTVYKQKYIKNLAEFDYTSPHALRTDSCEHMFSHPLCVWSTFRVTPSDGMIKFISEIWWIHENHVSPQNFPSGKVKAS